MFFTLEMYSLQCYLELEDHGFPLWLIFGLVHYEKESHLFFLFTLLGHQYHWFKTLTKTIFNYMIVDSLGLSICSE